jgi:hypothetical protein
VFLEWLSGARVCISKHINSLTTELTSFDNSSMCTSYFASASIVSRLAISIEPILVVERVEITNCGQTCIIPFDSAGTMPNCPVSLVHMQSECVRQSDQHMLNRAMDESNVTVPQSYI